MATCLPRTHVVTPALRFHPLAPALCTLRPCARRDLLEELMDDEDEVRELNLSSRPKREEKRRQRERERLEREMERELAERGLK